jgi:hypothetical protein
VRGAVPAGWLTPAPPPRTTGLYEKLGHSLLKMPMAFYWREPIGRILNRVSADTNIVDAMLGQSWSWFMMTIARVMGGSSPKRRD